MMGTKPCDEGSTFVVKKGGGEGKSCYSWKGNLPPNRPTPAACDYMVSQKVMSVTIIQGVGEFCGEVSRHVGGVEGP